MPYARVWSIHRESPPGGIRGGSLCWFDPRVSRTGAHRRPTSCTMLYCIRMRTLMSSGFAWKRQVVTMPLTPAPA